MLMTWALFMMWLVFNGIDLSISYLAECFGAGGERGVLAWVSSSWSSFAMNKMCLAVLVGGVLAYFRKDGWLAILTVCMVGLCVYNGSVLLQHLT